MFTISQFNQKKESIKRRLIGSNDKFGITGDIQFEPFLNYHILFSEKCKKESNKEKGNRKSIVETTNIQNCVYNILTP